MPNQPTDRAAERRFLELLHRQHGVGTTKQASNLRLTRSRVQLLIDRGVLNRPAYGLLRLAASKPTFERDVMTCCLAASNAVASHFTAVVRHLGPDLQKQRREPIHVLAPNHSRFRRQLGIPLVLHQTRSLRANERCRVGTIPATTPLRTLLDIAATKSPTTELDRLIAEALATRRLALSRLEHGLTLATTSRHPGAATLAAACARVLATGAGLTESVAERRLLGLLEEAGIELPVPQFTIWPLGKDGPSRRVDFAWPSERIAAEVDGYRWHGGQEQFRADRSKDRTSTIAGWRILRITPLDLEESPGRIVAEITALLDHRERPSL
ncbi:MAG: hypothetical protein ACRDZP_03340 [Acidimicrobiales bacterium]